MSETASTYEYVLIRVYPDPIRKEFLNVGVALYAPNGGFADAKVVKDFRRLQCLFPGFETDWTAGLEDELRTILRRDGRVMTSDQLFYLAEETFSQSLELSVRHGLTTDNPAAALRDLYRRFVAPPVTLATEAAAAPQPRTRGRILSRLAKLFDEEGLASLLDARMRAADLGTGGDPFRFDYHYQPNGVHKLIQAIDLERDTPGIKELSLTVERLRAGLQRRDLGLDVAAVHQDLPQEQAQPAGLLQFHRETLAAAGIRLTPLATAPALARQIRRDLQLQ